MTSGNQKNAKQRDPIPVHIQNVGGIHETRLTLEPGAINVLVGENGAGKSTAQKAITRALGGKASLEVRDGAHVGLVEVAGVRLQVKSAVRTTGEAEIELADAGPLTRLIDPGLKGSDEAATARVRALIEMIRPEFDASVITILADRHEEVVEAVAQELREGKLGDLVDLAERVRVNAHTLAREAEKRAAEAAGTATAAELTANAALERAGGADALVETPVSEAEAAERAAVEALGRDRSARQTRVALEEQQASIRETLSEAPNPERFDADIHLRATALVASQRRIDELGAALAKEREAMAGVRADHEALVTARAREVDAAKRHADQLLILNRPVTGPTEEELVEIEAAAARATELRRAAQTSAEVRTLAAQALAARKDRDEKAERAERLREIARGVFDRLAMLEGIAERAFPLTILAGRVHVIDGEQMHDFETRRSEGQRIDAAFAVAAKAYGAGAGDRVPIVALDARYWTALDADNRRAAAEAAATHGLAVLTEEPTSGPLAVAHLPARVASLAEATA